MSATLSSCASVPRQTTSLDETPLGFDSDRSNDRININTAPVSELEKLPGIGKALAERIVAHREQYGSFRRAEHLMMVRGISERKFRQLQPLVRVE